MNHGGNGGTCPHSFAATGAMPPFKDVIILCTEFYHLGEGANFASCYMATAYCPHTSNHLPPPMPCHTYISMTMIELPKADLFHIHVHASIGWVNMYVRACILNNHGVQLPMASKHAHYDCRSQITIKKSVYYHVIAFFLS